MSATTHTEAACKKCSFFDDQSTDLGLCRYNPPVSQPTAEAHGLWPKVAGNDWCGHYEPETTH